MTIYWICYKQHKALFSAIVYPYTDEKKRDQQYEKMLEEKDSKDISKGQCILL